MMLQFVLLFVFTGFNSIIILPNFIIINIHTNVKTLRLDFIFSVKCLTYDAVFVYNLLFVFKLRRSTHIWNQKWRLCNTLQGEKVINVFKANCKWYLSPEVFFYCPQNASKCLGNDRNISNNIILCNKC